MGPFYCPPDQKIYLDTGFFREVENRFHGCSGNACKYTSAYIIAHELGGFLDPSGIEHRTGSQEHQPGRAGLFRAGRQCRGPHSLKAEETAAGDVGDAFDDAIVAAVHQQYLADHPGRGARHQCRKRGDR